MPIMLILHGPEMTREQYDSLRPVVQWESEHPEGILLHTCGFDEAGGLHVVDIWESAGHMENFFQSRLMPAMQELNIAMPAPQVCEVHNVDAFPGIERHTP